jgi:hypothetical protein
MGLFFVEMLIFEFLIPKNNRKSSDHSYTDVCHVFLSYSSEHLTCGKRLSNIGLLIKSNILKNKYSSSMISVIDTDQFPPLEAKFTISVVPDSTRKLLV